MTKGISVWRIAQETTTYSADDLSGKGGLYVDGRWHKKGRRIIYAASSISLACLETVAHLNEAKFPFNRFLVRIDIPQDVFEKAIVIDAQSAPGGWDSIPIGYTSTSFGEQWLESRNSLILMVPSVITPEELNVLINPEHEDIEKIEAKTIRRWLYDPRMTGLASK